MRKTFATQLHLQMQKNREIYFLTADLGFGLFDQIFKDFPDRAINVGASEQVMLGMGVGLALEGKTPFCYSITPFLIYRAFEWIRNYLDHEKIAVRLIGSGRDDDYEHDGFSHDATDVGELFHHARGFFPNIKAYWPIETNEIPQVVESMAQDNQPSFLSLRR